jgi:hypothetical protein
LSTGERLAPPLGLGAREFSAEGVADAQKDPKQRQAARKIKDLIQPMRGRQRISGDRKPQPYD